LRGAAIPLWRRDSVDGKDDVSPKNLEFLKSVDSPKIRRGEYEIYDKGVVVDDRKMFTFSEIDYRHAIAAKYDLGMMGFVTPFLPEEQPPEVLAMAESIKNEIKAKGHL